MLTNLTKDKNDYCFAKSGEVYAVYLPEGNTTEILLPSEAFSIDWFNPRTGGDLKKGTIERIARQRICFNQESTCRRWE